MTSQPHTIHDFSKPPVVETVLSVQFTPLSGFSIAHFGLYWQKIREEFKRVEVRPPVAHMKEDFSRGAIRGMPQFGLELVSEPEIRCWFMDEPGNQILQVQKDRFIHNWQKITGDEIYPRYEAVRGTFDRQWRRFCDFLTEEKLGKPEVNQCEVTYVNHIEYDNGWKTFGELNKVIAPWSGSYSGSFLRAPEKVSLNATYVFPDNKGRLYVFLQPVLRTRDAKEVLQLNLIARGAPSSSETGDLLQWLDLGREWIVKGFTDFTTKEMHKHWGRTK